MQKKISEPKQLSYVLADQLPDGDEIFDDELVEGVVGRDAMVVLYGDSNSGKTFAAIDMCASICRGTPWLGRSTDKGLVVYLASESPSSVCMRLRAYHRYYKVRVPNLVIVKSPINLFDSNADILAVQVLVKHLESEHGTKAVLIVGDTLARLAAGANENSGEDMGMVVKNIDAIRAALRVSMALIHHTGKDAAKGMRGWSGLRAATDTEIEVTANESTGSRALEITKQRDLPTKGQRLGFRLENVILGANRWGTLRGSCVVVPTDAPPKTARGKRVGEIAGAIIEFLTERGVGCMRGRIKEHFADRYVAGSVYRELNKLLDAGLLIETAGVFALPGRPGPAE